MHVLIATGMTLPSVGEAELQRIRSAAGDDAEVSVAASRGEALEAISTAEVLFGALDPTLFAAANSLRWVQATASGVDKYLFPEFKASDVVLTGEKGLVGGHLADHAFALLLALTRKLAEAVRLGPQSWEQRLELRPQEIELEGLTMGIVGFGGTGREVARRATAFGMHGRAVDRDAVPGTAELPLVQSLNNLPRLLAQSDVVTICCPLTPATRGLFNDETLALMKPTAILINVTRGEIVDGDALVRALREGRLAGAGLDVTPEEPLPADHPLWQFDNVVITPHIAGASQLRAGRNIERFCENLRRYRRGLPLIGLVDKDLGY